MKALGRLVNIQPEERPLVLLLILLSFCFGAANNFIETAAFTLFLEASPPGDLPYTQIITAFAISGLAALYLRLEARLSFARLLTANVVALAVIAAVFRVGLSSPAAAAVAFLLPVLFQIQVNFVNLVFWPLAGRLFTVQQGKRLFGLANSGLWIGIILTGFGMPLFVRAVGTANLLWLGAAGMGASLFVLRRILARHGAAFQQAPAPKATQKARAPLAHTRYIGLIFALVAVWWVAFFAINLLFYDRVYTRFADSAAIASFLGQYLAWLGIFTWFVNTFVAARFIGRFGERATLLLLPALLVVLSLAGLAASSAGAALSLVFLLTVILKILNLGLGFSIDRSGLTILYQPLPGPVRTRAQALAEGVVQSLAVGASGILLLALARVFHLEYRGLYAFVLTLAVIWMAVAFLLGRQYGHMLVEALQKRFFGRGAEDLLDRTAFQHLAKGLESRSPAVVIYSLQLLEIHNYPDFQRALLGLLHHPSPEVQVDAIQRIEARRLTRALPDLARLAQPPTAPTVRGRALQALAALGEVQDVMNLKGHLDSPEPEVVRAALAGLLLNDKELSLSLALKALDRLVASPQPAERRLAASVLETVGQPRYGAHLARLLDDPDKTVQRAALFAARRVPFPAVWEKSIALLAAPGLTNAALAALVSINPASESEATLADAFGKSLESGNWPHAAQLGRALGRAWGSASLAALVAHLDHPHRRVRAAVLKALTRRGWQAPPAERERVTGVLRGAMNEWAWSLAAQTDALAQPDADTRLLNSAIELDGRYALRMGFLALALLYPPGPVLRARAVSRSPQAGESQRAYALELLEITLKPEHRAWFAPVFTAGTPAEKLATLQRAFPQPTRILQAWLLEILERPPEQASAWLKAVALHTAARQKLAALQHPAETAAAHPSPFVREAAAELLHTLDPKGNRALLKALGKDPDGRVSAAATRRLGKTKGKTTMLSTIERVLLLKSTPTFQYTPDEILAELAGLLHEVELGAGAGLFSKDDPGDCMYILASGKLRVHDGRTFINSLGPGEVVGEMAMLDSEPRSASVTAEEDSLLLRLDQEPFYDLMDERIEVVRGIIGVLSGRLRSAVGTMRDLRAQYGDATVLKK
ncbi:MAG: HEAT repeat domain-containing protein [Chloroflexi bacterium]|nr:HEAT repeat domain-containing protein [Chloroflexota bacterium]